jgi:hypothetical protein
MDYRTGSLISYGIPRYQALTPRTKKELKLWQKNRQKAYSGSFDHFLQSLKEDEIEENGFQVKEVFRKYIEKDTSLIDEKIQYFREKLFASSGNTHGMVLSTNNPIIDSLSYWNEIKNAPDYRDSLGAALLSKNSLMDNSNTICCKSILQISYLNEREELGYRNNGDRDRKQTSLVHLPGKSLSVDESGYYDVEKVVFEHYYAWSSKIAEMLPLDYIRLQHNSSNRGTR